MTRELDAALSKLDRLDPRDTEDYGYAVREALGFIVRDLVRHPSQELAQVSAENERLKAEAQQRIEALTDLTNAALRKDLGEAREALRRLVDSLDFVSVDGAEPALRHAREVVAKAGR